MSTRPAAAASTEAGTRACWRTPATPGAIGILEIQGNIASLLPRWTGRVAPRPMRPALRRLGGIDDGVVLVTSPTGALVMPHGGVAIARALEASLAALGVAVQASPAHYPEARDEVEEFALSLMATAASPLAVPLLLRQRQAWLDAGPGWTPTGEDRHRAHRLKRLLDPPLVVLSGAPNSGKSSLTNALAGRSVSLVWHEPGSTRDAVGARIDLAGLVVEWRDCPGLRDAASPAERQAVAMARELIERADLVVAMAEPGGAWPDSRADLRILSKADLLAPAAPLPTGVHARVSAHSGEGIEALVTLIRDRLLPPGDLANPAPWLMPGLRVP